MESQTHERCPACGSSRTKERYRRSHRGRTWSLAQCESCALQFTSPAPTEEDIRSFYSGDYHSELRNALATEEAFGPKFSRYVDMLGRHLYGGRVVDVGCSTGLLVRMLCDRGYEAEGVELNEHSAAWGVERYKVRIHTQPLQACEFRAQSLDAVFMTDVLEHTEHPGQFLRDVGRLLVPGGFAVVTFPDISSVESRYQFLLSRLLRRDWVWSSCHIPLHVWEFSRRTAEACFADAGFRVVEFRRSQLPREENGSLALKLLNLPLRLLSLPLVEDHLGTQMEFVIQKAVDVSKGQRASGEVDMGFPRLGHLAAAFTGARDLGLAF
jgi:2-polyprenyl-3-methyl-5-hydroxy-6-metoxy-1,4-benzoquinol methylase